MNHFKQERNELCGCGSGKKFKKCCGRFSLDEMCGTLAQYAAANKGRDKLIRRSLRFLECSPEGSILCLVNPQLDQTGVTNWTQICNRTPRDEKEAVVTRRILAGYLPMCVLVADKGEPCGWKAVIDAGLVAEEVRREFVAFARCEAEMIVRTMKREIAPEDSWMFPTPWEDRSYPGMPLKPRPATTVRIEVNVAQRRIRTVWGQYGAMDFPIPESHYADHNGMEEAEFALDEAGDVIRALSQTSPPKQLVEGDRVEAYLSAPDAETKLLAVFEVKPKGLEGSFGMGGDA